MHIVCEDRELPAIKRLRDAMLVVMKGIFLWTNRDWYRVFFCFFFNLLKHRVFYFC